jgi:hypothetical protein
MSLRASEGGEVVASKENETRPTTRSDIGLTTSMKRKLDNVTMPDALDLDTMAINANEPAVALAFIKAGRMVFDSRIGCSCRKAIDAVSETTTTSRIDRTLLDRRRVGASDLVDLVGDGSLLAGRLPARAWPPTWRKVNAKIVMSGCLCQRSLRRDTMCLQMTIASPAVGRRLRYHGRVR